jgi:hypothetical protein
VWVVTWSEGRGLLSKAHVCVCVCVGWRLGRADITKAGQCQYQEKCKDLAPPHGAKSLHRCVGVGVCRLGR